MVALPDIFAHTPAIRSLLPFKIVGDSMAPTFQPGDWVVVDTSDRRPSPDGVFVIWDGLGLVAQRLASTFTNPARVRVSSDNPRYTAYEVAPAALEVEGRVVGVFNRL